MTDDIIYDCDNTFGVPGCPVDDGLALLYLLGKPNANLLGITTTYGNSSVDVVYENTRQMLRELGRKNIPVLRGGINPDHRSSEAARFLVDQVNEHAGNIKILATGALANLYAAYNTDADFFGKVNEIVLMGGITEPLILNKVGLDELNFSCDPQASHCVLTNGENLSIATGNNCLPAYMRHQDYKKRLLDSSNPIGRYVYEKTKNWFDFKEKTYNLEGFYNWDVVAAAYLLEKSFFDDYILEYRVTVDDLKQGYIGNTGDPTTHRANLPSIRNAKALLDEIYESWFRVHFNLTH